MFAVEIWGTVAEWVSGVGTAAAALIAAWVYAVGRRQDRWSQASLVFYEPSGGNFNIHNRSDMSIFNVTARLEKRSFLSAARSRSYDEDVLTKAIVGDEHEFYKAAKEAHKKSTEHGYGVQRYVFAPELKAGDSRSIDGMWAFANGMRSSIEFSDAFGRRWLFDIDKERLKPAKQKKTILAAQNRNLRALSWIARNELKIRRDKRKGAIGESPSANE